MRSITGLCRPDLDILLSVKQPKDKREWYLRMLGGITRD